MNTCVSPAASRERARDLIRSRPFNSWADVERVPGFSKGMIDDLKSGGAVIREGVMQGAGRP